MSSFYTWRNLASKGNREADVSGHCLTPSLPDLWFASQPPVPQQTGALLSAKQLQNKLCYYHQQKAGMSDPKERGQMSNCGTY